MLRFFFSYVLLNIFGLLAAAFLAQNFRIDHLAFFGLEFSVNFVWILLGSATFGFLLAFLLLIPGRVAVGLHSGKVEREADALEAQVTQLQQHREELFDRLDFLMEGQERALARYHRLLAEHGRVVADRDQAIAQLALLEREESQRSPAEAPMTVKLSHTFAAARD